MSAFLPGEATEKINLLSERLLLVQDVLKWKKNPDILFCKHENIISLGFGVTGSYEI